MSFQKSLNIPKVGPQFANNVYSDRNMNYANAVCIAPNFTDGYGRFNHPYSFKSLTHGCPNDPLLRIEVENALRPSYAITLDTDGISKDEQSYASSFRGTDTLLGNKVGANRVRYFDRNPEYQIPQPNWDSENAFFQGVEANNRALRRLHENSQYKNAGMF
jgi:hypothetical protein